MNDKTTTLGQCPNEMYRSSLTLSAVIETKKRWYRSSFLRMNCYILLLFPRMTVGLDSSSKANKIFTWWSSQDLSTRLPVI